MPLWNFRCNRCSEDFQLFLSRKELKQGVRCPRCDSMDHVEGPVIGSTETDAPVCGISAPS